MKFVALYFITILSTAFAENPFDETKYGLSFSYLHKPTLFTDEAKAAPSSISRSFGATFVVDLPIYRFLHSGYVIRYLTSPKDGDVGGILDLSVMLKPALGLSSPIGHLGVYGMAAAGFSVTFLPIQASAFTNDDGTPHVSRHVHPFGGLVNAFAKGGIEYFPSSFFGIFFEAGFNYWYFLHHVNDKMFEPRFKFFTYHLTAYSFDAGLKYTF